MRSVPIYLSINMNKQLKRTMTKVRFGISDLFVHHFRYRKCNEQNCVCPLCKDAKETEVHFVLCCPALSDLRNQLIPRKYYRNPSLFHLILLMASTNETTVKKFAVYLYKGFQIRSTICS